MNHYLSFENIEENTKFAEEFAKENHLKSNNMGVREIVIEEYRKEVFEKGMEAGMEKGMEKGMALKPFPALSRPSKKALRLLI